MKRNHNATTRLSGVLRYPRFHCLRTMGAAASIPSIDAAKAAELAGSSFDAALYEVTSRLEAASCASIDHKHALA